MSERPQLFGSRFFSPKLTEQFGPDVPRSQSKSYIFRSNAVVFPSPSGRHESPPPFVQIRGPGGRAPTVRELPPRGPLRDDRRAGPSAARTESRGPAGISGFHKLVVFFLIKSKAELKCH